MSDCFPNVTKCSPPDLDTRQIIHDKLVRWLREEASLDVASIDYDNSIFEMGVDSLGAASIAAEVEQQTGKPLNPEIVFDCQTINELAAYVDSVRPLRVTAATTVACAVVESRNSPPVAEAGPTAAVSPIDHYVRLNRRVNAAKEAGQYFFETEISAHRGAWIEVSGERMLMLGSYQYLGMLEHPRVMEAAQEAAERFGLGHHGSRLLTGTTSVHLALEKRLAEFMQAQAAIVYSSGYVANLATISSLMGPGDCIIGDRWNHASIADGCRMAGATLLEFEHNDMRSLEQRLRQSGGARTLVIVDSVFSMDGDIVDLPNVVGLCRRYNALLMVDEAHSLGVMGRTGRGIQEHFNLAANDIDVKMGTLSKGFGGSGGFVAGCEEIVTYLRHHARGYIFSGALPACEAAVALAAIAVLEQTPELVERLWHNLDYYMAGLRRLGFDCGVSATPIVPIMTGNDRLALEMTHLCRTLGLFVIPVVFPAVPMDAPRLRTSLSAVHSQLDLDFALDVLGRAGRQTGLLAG